MNYFFKKATGPWGTNQPNVEKIKNCTEQFDCKFGLVLTFKKQDKKDFGVFT